MRIPAHATGIAGASSPADNARQFHPKRGVRWNRGRAHTEPEGCGGRGGDHGSCDPARTDRAAPALRGRRYDLIIDLESTLLRVQCKLARRTGGVLAIGLQTSRCTPRGYVRTSYSPAEIDAVGAYSAELSKCYLLPISAISGRRSLYLRLEPTGNNQAEGITWACDHELEPVIERLRVCQQKRSQAGQLHFPDQIEGL